jgi:hypothetical protein
MERIIGQKQLKIDFLEKQIELAEEAYGVDIKKNSLLHAPLVLDQPEKTRHQNEHVVPGNGPQQTGISSAGRPAAVALGRRAAAIAAGSPSAEKSSRYGRPGDIPAVASPAHGARPLRGILLSEWFQTGAETILPS